MGIMLFPRRKIQRRAPALGLLSPNAKL